MHIPDGYLDPWMVLITFLLTGGYAAVAYKRMGSLSMERVSFLSSFAAGIFVAQMLNWPLPGGTSLHLVGGGLAGILLGPYLGFLAMSLVLVIQCIVFHDGGVTALGANILNMAILGVVTGYIAYKIAISVVGKNSRGRFIGGFLAGWLGIVVAGLACGIEIGFSTYFGFNLDVTVPIMVSWHATLGVIEGLITAFIIEYIYSRNPKYILSGGVEDDGLG